MNKSLPLLIGTFFIISPTIANPTTPPLVTSPQGKSPSENPSEANIKIISDQMDCDQERNLCIATGNATAEKLNDSKVKILKADQITAHFAKDPKKGTSQVKHLVANGNVFFIIGDIAVQGKQGEYLVDSEIAKVKDDVKITQGKNQLDGGYAEVNMRTGHYSLRHNGERVQAMIYTQEKAAG